MNPTEIDIDGFVRHGWATLPEVRLHYVEATSPADQDAPLLVLLHGFPEFWYSWRHQIPSLAEAGFRVVAPDMRGFNLSEKPRGVRNYRVEKLAADVAALVDYFDAPRAHVVGHDWGGMVAWWFAMLHPDKAERISVLNCPHPEYQLAMMRDPQQIKKSHYMLIFQLPWLAERAFKRDDFAVLRRVFTRDPERKEAFSHEDIERYVEAFGGEATTASMNYYRALLQRSPFAVRRMLRPIECPVQVIWGTRDRHIGIEYSRPSPELVPDLEYETVDEAGHWLQNDAPVRVNELVREFASR